MHARQAARASGVPSAAREGREDGTARLPLDDTPSPATGFGRRALERASHGPRRALGVARNSRLSSHR